MTSRAAMRLSASTAVRRPSTAVPSRLLTVMSPVSPSIRPPLCSAPYSTRSLSRSSSAGYPLLAVGVSLIAAQQLLFHTSAQSSATSPAASSPTATASPSSPPSSSASPPSPPPPPTFDLTSLPYASKQSFLHGASVVLYQYQTCPFCNKVRAYLDYHRIPYELVEVNPMNKKEIAFTGLKAVPVVSVDGVVMHESSSIVSAFDRLFQHYDTQNAIGNAHAGTAAGQRQPVAAAATSSSSSSPSSSSARAEEERWRQWVDSELIFLTAPNLYTSLSASLQSMDYIMSNTSLPLSQRLLSKYLGGPMMFLVTELKLKKKRGITDARAQLFAALRQWDSEALQGRRFRGGDRPDLSDLAVFGVCRAMMGFPVGDEMMDGSRSSRGFVDWYDRMEAAVGPSAARGGGGIGGVGADFVRAPTQTKVGTAA